MRYLSIVFLLFAIGCGEPVSSELEPNHPIFGKIEAQGDYTHSPSAMKFPEKVGSFKRTQLRRYDTAAENISAEYKFSSLGSGSAIAKVYIYPVWSVRQGVETALDEHFEQVKQTLLDIYPDAADIEEGTITTGQPWGPEVGKTIIFSHKSKKLFKNKLCRSRTYLFDHGQWFIKYRITYPKSNQDRVDGKINEFMHLLTWPKIE